jgi:hypothetical protein
MSQNANILQELRELESSLANQPAQPVFSVPEGYFDGLAETVMRRLKAFEATDVVEELSYLSPRLNEISREMPYEVPSGYFEELNEKAWSIIEKNRTAHAELSELSPLLAGLKKQMPYEVPQGYFENSVPAGKVVTAKVVSISSRSWFKFAAAAIVTGVIVLAGFIYFNSKPDPVDEPYAWVKKSIKKVDKTEIDEFVTLANQEITGSNSIVSFPKPEEIKELMKDISDKELQDFLNDAPDVESVDVMLN